jgi:hypothetical protein
MNSVDRTFRRRSDLGNADVDCIRPDTRAQREIPLRGASRRGSAGPDETHHSALCTSCSNIIPTLVGSFVEPQ